MSQRGAGILEAEYPEPFLGSVRGQPQFSCGNGRDGVEQGREEDSLLKPLHRAGAGTPQPLDLVSGAPGATSQVGPA